MKLVPRPFVAVALAALSLAAVTGCASEASLGIPRVALANPDPPPMCVALRGSVAAASAASTTELTAASLPFRSAPAAGSRKAAESSTVKDRQALVVAKGS